ncbi:hypothetical protein GQ43DRAFT_89154 [Delitschia confertaspora ATCC 74209]|uniref:Uncharacterized protein n=1 Tax=Delitschia confertaspora ATCC 74209 TaxID=1513339 RepID=A0A9P4JL00_9PLEO|nr:hypothetical protein GQ43DRAFT_89154 [Delitschia confertaspora ATCC 74209]
MGSTWRNLYFQTSPGIRWIGRSSLFHVKRRHFWKPGRIMKSNMPIRSTANTNGTKAGIGFRRLSYFLQLHKRALILSFGKSCLGSFFLNFFPHILFSSKTQSAFSLSYAA